MLNISGRKFPHYGVILIPCYIVPLTQIIKNILSINKLKFKVALVALTSFIIGIACKDPIITQIGEIKKQFIEDLNLNTEVSEYIIENTEVTDNILVLGNKCNIYNATGRRYYGKYEYQLPIMIIDKRITEEIVEDIEKNKPKVIVYIGDYYSFCVQRYTKSDDLYKYLLEKEEVLKEAEEGALEYLDSYIEQIKSITIVYEKVNKMQEEGIYNIKINERSVIWTLAEE